MLLNVYCEKCGENFKIDIGDRTREETIDMLSKRETFECPGNHVESSSPVNYWRFGKVEAGKAPSEAAWVKSLKAALLRSIQEQRPRSKSMRLRDFLWVLVSAETGRPEKRQFSTSGILQKENGTTTRSGDFYVVT